MTRATQSRAASAPDLRLHGLTLARGRHPAIRSLTGCFAGGSLTAVVGPNGAGKTTLLEGMAGLLAPAAGRVECVLARREMAYLPQANETDRRFPITVSDFVTLGAWRRIGGFAAAGRAVTARVHDAIGIVGMTSRAHAWIGDLSGGQFQRARFARMLVQDAPLWLLDEPFAGIDARTAGELLQLILHRNDSGTTAIVVLHDLALVRDVFPSALALDAGRCLAWGGTDATLDALERAKRPVAPLRRSPS